MAPLTQAVRTSFFEQRGDVRVYNGEVDNVWTVIALPHGGYALGLVIDACVAAQSHMMHTEIIHITGHFLRPSLLGPFEVHIRTVRIGSFYANLSAELVQKSEIRISAQIIFKKTSIAPNDPRLTLLPPSPYARRIPLHTHPSIATPRPIIGNVNFKTQVKRADDKDIEKRNHALGHGGPKVGGNGLEWGAWIELVDPEEGLNEASLAFVGDMMMNLPTLLPKDQRPPLGWYPTMVLSLEFKTKIPRDPAFSRRTVGLYSCARFMHEGRHDVYVEIWTSPAAIGEGVEVDGWREKQVCLGIAHQMGLVVPRSVNERKAAQASGKL